MYIPIWLLIVLSFIPFIIAMHERPTVVHDQRDDDDDDADDWMWRR